MGKLKSNVVGISGYMGSGKDTAAKALIEMGFSHTAFAKRLKDVLVAMDPLVSVDGYECPLGELVAQFGWDGAKKMSEVRRLLQGLGQAVRDNLNVNAWTAPVQTDIHHARLNGDIGIVVTDVRYANEAFVVKANHLTNYWGYEVEPTSESGTFAQGVLIWVERPGQHEKNIKGLGPLVLHESESSSCRELADYIVTNDGSEADLAKLVQALVWGGGS